MNKLIDDGTENIETKIYWIAKHNFIVNYIVK